MTPGQSPELQQILQQLTSLQAAVLSLEAQVQAVRGLPSNVVQPPAGPTLQSLAREVAVLAQNYQAINERLGQLAKVGPAGRSAPNILGNMQQDPAYRNEVVKAVQGRLRVHNYTGVPQTLYINGSRWTVPVNESTTYLPIGHVSLLVGGRQQQLFTPSDWKFNAERGEFELTYAIPR